jgi:hypothetical protein
MRREIAEKQAKQKAAQYDFRAQRKCVSWIMSTGHCP